MNLRSIFAAPWCATHRWLRWLTLVIFAGCCAGAVAVGMFDGQRHWWLISTAIYCIGAGYLWAFLMSSLLLLCIYARQLRIPGMLQAVVLSLPCYGALTVSLPVMLLSACGADALVVALLVALAVTTGLAFVLLPRYISILIGFLPAATIGLRHLIQVPVPPDPRFASWAACALVGLLLVDAMRWRRLLLDESTVAAGYTSAMVMQFRRNGGMGNWSGLAQRSATEQIRQRPDWMLAQVDLRKVSTRKPVTTLRVTLGSFYMPQSWISYVRQLTPVLLPMLLFIPIMVLMRAGDAHHVGLQDVERSIGISVVGWLGIFGGVMLASTTVLVLGQRWKRVNAELPLLALLPGLGDRAALRLNLLRAVLAQPLLAQGALLVLVLGAALAMHLGNAVLAFALLSQLGCAAVLVAFVLSTLGGCSLSPSPKAVMLIAAFVLVTLSVFIPVVAHGRHPWPSGAIAEAALLAGWTLLAAALFWLGRRGWRGLQQRPHPFLPN